MNAPEALTDAADSSNLRQDRFRRSDETNPSPALANRTRNRTASAPYATRNAARANDRTAIAFLVFGAIAASRTGKNSAFAIPARRATRAELPANREPAADDPA
ncbi:MAG TPA: hypothetical protein VNC50_15715, partial [Planctomycetia bacterium]|nr:hypothetical protein [Planctomycetia bacterium]